jgi:hypothetical protein
LVPNRGAQKVAGDSRLEFNDAVQECLASCYRTDLPVAALAEYVEVLKQRDWTLAEIHRVEAAVLKILLAVVSKDERDDLVNRMIKPRGEKLAAPRPEAESFDSARKHGQKRASGPESQERCSGKTRPPENRSSGNVFPSRGFPSQNTFGSGQGTGRRP